MSLNKHILLLSILFILISCGDDTDAGTYLAPINPLDTQGNLLNGTWNLEPLSDKPSIKDVTPVTKDGMVVDVFNNMTITISGGSAVGGSYSTLDNYDYRIWPSSGTWKFKNDKNEILRSDGVVMSIFVELIHNYAQPKRYFLRISFTTTDGNKKVDWVFNFVRECSSPFNDAC
jgi:hypothetical protein